LQEGPFTLSAVHWQELIDKAGGNYGRLNIFEGSEALR